LVYELVCYEYEARGGARYPNVLWTKPFTDKESLDAEIARIAAEPKGDKVLFHQLKADGKVTPIDWPAK
jgi:hypothetical protein